MAGRKLGLTLCFIVHLKDGGSRLHCIQTGQCCRTHDSVDGCQAQVNGCFRISSQREQLCACLIKALQLRVCLQGEEW